MNAALDWSRWRVLVTGAGGFIGSHLTERLVALHARTRALVLYNSTNSWGWLDRSPVKDDVEVVLGDIRDFDHLVQLMRGVDVVFHLAALVAIPFSYHAPLSYVRTNVEGTLNVLQAALRANVSLVVHTSTSEVYGTATRIPIDENHPLQAQSPYSATKIAADKLADAFHLSFGLPVTTIRPFNTYGPRQSSRAVIPTIITQVFTQPIVRLGNLTPTRDFNYVKDVVEGFIRIAETPHSVGGVFNIGSGTEISIGTLAATICHLVGRELSVVRDESRVRPEGSEVERLCADSTRACQQLGWTPRYTLEQGLMETIDWIMANLDQYRVGAYVV